MRYIIQHHIFDLFYNNRMSVEFLSVRQELLHQSQLETEFGTEGNTPSYENRQLDDLSLQQIAFGIWKTRTLTEKANIFVPLSDMTGLGTMPNPKPVQLKPRGKPVVVNRCISSNITVVHTEDGKPPIITKQSTFSVPSRNGQTATWNVTRIEEDCTESMNGDESTSSSSSSSSASSVASTTPLPKLPTLRVRSLYAKTSHDALRLALRQLEWKEQARQDGGYDIYWHGIAFEDAAHENVSQIHAINKLPGMLELSHKVQLSRILKRMQTLFPGEFNFYPASWIIPEQYHQFLGEVSIGKYRSGRMTPENKGKRPPVPQYNRTFIVKPDMGRQGDGIYLVTDPRDVQAAAGCRQAIVQEYIDSPLLLDGYKFDLRIYVVIARLNPIEIYLCKEGLARLCTVPYEPPNKLNVKNSFMHLTNYSLNKNSEDFVQTDAAETGSKRTLSSVEEVLARKGYNVRQMRKSIRRLAAKTILAVSPDLVVWNHASNISKTSRCFQILGFDVMLSSDMKAHLLEVNAVPSLRIDTEQEVEPESGHFETVISAVDEQVKVTLIRDTLELIAMGEENVDMKSSCLRRIYPVALDRTFGRHNGDPPQNRSCDDNCQLHGIHGERPKLSSQVSSWRTNGLRAHEDNSLRAKLRNGWSCNRKCPQCNTPVKRKMPAATVVKYEVPANDVMMSTDWRFFDYKLIGSAVLAQERQPMVNRYVNLESERSKLTDTPESNEEDEPYEKCKNCGAYLEEIVGPGVLQEREKSRRQIAACHRKATSIDHQPTSDSTGYTHKPSQWPHDFRDAYNLFKIKNSKATPDATEIILPRYNYDTPRSNPNCVSWGYGDSPSSESSISDCASSDDRTDTPRPRPNAILMRIKHGSLRKEKEGSFSGYHVMLLRRAAKVFIFFNGIKPSLTMGATAFRNMARRCSLCEQGALPSIDILYIDTLRQWQNYRATHGTPFYLADGEKKDLKSKKAYLRQTFGLPFQGFVEALFKIANQRYRGDSLRDKMEALITGCERYMASAKKKERRVNEKGGTLLSPWKRPPSGGSRGVSRTNISRGSYPLHLTPRNRFGPQ